MAESDAKDIPDAESMMISIELDYERTVNYAMQQNDVPVVKALRIRNGSESVLRDLIVRITVEPAFAASWESRISVINSGETFSKGVVDLPLSHNYLAGLTERDAGFAMRGSDSG